MSNAKQSEITDVYSRQSLVLLCGCQWRSALNIVTGSVNIFNQDCVSSDMLSKEEGSKSSIILIASTVYLSETVSSVGRHTKTFRKAKHCRVTYIPHDGCFWQYITLGNNTSNLKRASAIDQNLNWVKDLKAEYKRRMCWNACNFLLRIQTPAKWVTSLAVYF